MNWIGISCVVIFVSSVLFFYFKYYRTGDMDLSELILYPSIVGAIIFPIALMVKCNDSDHKFIDYHQCHYTGNSDTVYIPQTTLVGKVMVTNLMPITSYQWKCNDGKKYTFDFDSND